jgi:hypothetical protein
MSAKSEIVSVVIVVTKGAARALTPRPTATMSRTCHAQPNGRMDPFRAWYFDISNQWDTNRSRTLIKTSASTTSDRTLPTRST